MQTPLPYSPEEIEYLRNNYRTLTLREMCEGLKKELGSDRKIDGLWNKLQKLGFRLTKEETLAKQLKTAWKAQPAKEFPFKGYSIYSIVYFGMQHRLTKRIRQSTPSPRIPTFTHILIDISNVFDIPVELIKSKSRNVDVVFCKKLFCYIAHRLSPEKTQESISKFIGYKHRTSVIYALQYFNDCISVHDPSFMSYWNFYLQHTDVFISKVSKLTASHQR